MEIKGNKIILRDFLASDIEKRIYWETVENEWQQWDAPWEYEGLTEEEKEEELRNYIASLKRWVEQDAELAEAWRKHEIRLWIYKREELVSLSCSGNHRRR